MSAAGARTAARLAVRSARAAEPTCRRPIAVVPSGGPTNGRYESRVVRNPFDVDRGEKLALLRDAERALHVGPEVKNGHASMQAWEQVSRFASSEGVTFQSRVVHVGAGVDATAAAHGEVQRRSGPNSFGGDYGQAGYEFIERLALADRARTVGTEAVALLDAPNCPTLPSTTVVLATDQLALQVHESVGHATELDRVLASEAGFAGTSFLAPSDRGELRYGSEAMTVVADATEPGGSARSDGTTKARRPVRTTLVDRGRLTGFLTNRETAAALGLPRSGAMARAGGSTGPPDPDDERRPPAGRPVARRAPRRGPGRRVLRDEPVVVDRRPSAQLPVRHRGRPSDRQRRARPARPQPDLRRDDPAVLGVDGRRRGCVDLAPLGDPELREGPANPDRPRRPRGAGGAVPQRPGLGGLTVPPGPADLERVATRVLERVPSGVAADVRVRSEGWTTMRFANGHVHQPHVEEARSVSLRVVHDHRIATATTTDMRAEGLARLVREAVALAAMAPVDRRVGPFPPARKVRAVPYSRSTAALVPESVGRLAAAALDAAGAETEGVRVSGAVHAGAQTLAVANTSGRLVSGIRTASQGSVLVERPAEDPPVSGWAEGSHWDAGKLRPDRIGTEALRRMPTSPPRSAKPCMYRVLLEGAAVQDIVGFLCHLGFSGHGEEEG